MYFAIRRTRWCTYWLLLASYFFYGWWNPLYLILIAVSTLVDWLAALALTRYSFRRTSLVVSVCLNLGLLSLFKYGNFLADNVNAVLTHLGWPAMVPHHDWLLPVGISFYTFQSMSYTIDVYRGRIKPERNLAIFALYVSFFPQLVAGPIERASHLLHQLRIPRQIDWPLISSGASLFLAGLFKKVMLGDFLGQYVQRVYGVGSAVPELETISGLSVLLATYAFAWQIYFDFSGYTDMARGIARVMGFSLMENFRAPYLATSPSEFWKRWHISLSTWLRDYLYIPLGGNRCGSVRTHINLLITMILGGLWHGNTWNFIVWGAIHGLVLIGGRLLGQLSWMQHVPAMLKRLVLFHVVCVTWVFFRAWNLETAFQLFDRLFFHFPGPNTMPILAIVIVIGAFLRQYAHEQPLLQRKIVAHPAWEVLEHAAMILLLLFFSGRSATPFIYFQF